MKGVPLLLGVNPTKGFIGPKVPVHVGKWRVYGNNRTSRIVIIIDSPVVCFRQELEFGVPLEIHVIERGIMFAEILEKGNESHISVGLEKL